MHVTKRPSAYRVFSFVWFLFFLRRNTSNSACISVDRYRKHGSCTRISSRPPPPPPPRTRPKTKRNYHIVIIVFFSVCETVGPHARTHARTGRVRGQVGGAPPRRARSFQKKYLIFHTRIVFVCLSTMVFPLAFAGQCFSFLWKNKPNREYVFLEFQWTRVCCDSRLTRTSSPHRTSERILQKRTGLNIRDPEQRFVQRHTRARSFGKRARG